MMITDTDADLHEHAIAELRALCEKLSHEVRVLRERCHRLETGRILSRIHGGCRAITGRTIGEALLLLAGIRALTSGPGILDGMRIDPTVDGRVMLRCGEHVAFAPVPVGMTFEALVTSDNWFDPCPLEAMEAEGNA